MPRVEPQRGAVDLRDVADGDWRIYERRELRNPEQSKTAAETASVEYLNGSDLVGKTAAVRKGRTPCDTVEGYR